VCVCACLSAVATERARMSVRAHVRTFHAREPFLVYVPWLSAVATERAHVSVRDRGGGRGKGRELTFVPTI
jgi:hypothetical protein